MATKQSLYFPEKMLREITNESLRLDRSISWTVQQAWRLARAELSNMPVAAPTRDRQERGLQPVVSDERGPSAQVLEFLKGKFETATG
jgi:uncharacterized small protein (TIGR04563 family)